VDGSVVTSIRSSADLLTRLHHLGYDNPSRDPWWWPNTGEFQTVISAIMTQNTTWISVEKSLKNLVDAFLLDPRSLTDAPREQLEELIRPSGYYRNKARNIQEIAQALMDDFGDFETFTAKVTRDWLMSRRGVGHETADAILNYACYREAMVVDSYTARLLEALKQSQKDYRAVQSWMLEGVEAGCRAAFPDLSLAQCYARYHGMVVEYCKVNRAGKRIDAAPLMSI
jgi:endonuclease-3 related protein